MSDKMTDERWGVLNNTQQEWTPQEECEVAVEVARARASEAEKEQRIEEQAQEIERIRAQLDGVQTLQAAQRDSALREVSALRAELECLKPSGPVAEDEARLREALDDGGNVALIPNGHASLDRLAAGAQSVQVLAEALDGTAPRKSSILGPCWCTHVEFIPPRDDLHGPECITRRAALRLVGRLP